MSAWIIISGLVAMLLVGLGTYIVTPIVFETYASDDVQNMTGAAKFAADTNYQIVSVMSMLLTGAVFLNMWSRATRHGSSGFLE